MAFREQMLPDLPRLSQAQVIQYIKAAQEGDKEARDKLVNSNLRLISTMLRRFQGRGYEEDDLFQIGVIGLIKAIDRFDTTYEVRFSTYAVPMIIGEIKRFLRDDGPLKVSRTYKDNLIQIRRAQEKLRDCLGREPTLGELEAEVGLPKEILTASLEAGCSPFSIDEAVYGDDGSPLYRVDQLKSPQNEEEDSVKRLALEEMLEKGSVTLVSDVGCGALCCAAALESASMNIFVNTKTLLDREAAAKLDAREAGELAGTDIQSTSRNGRVENGYYILTGTYVCIEDIGVEEQILLD